MTLSGAKEKQKVKVLEISGGNEAKYRLISMGIRPGSEIEIIRNSNKGPIIIAIDTTKLMLGRGLANKIVIQ